jgi:hypothetical protein
MQDKFPYAVPEPFIQCLGDKRFVLPPSDIHRGGTVSFRRHIGNILTIELWQDLYERLLCRQINVYVPGEGMKTIGHMERGVFIHLDKDFKVDDIRLAL